LAWLEREIAHEDGAPPRAAIPLPPRLVQPSFSVTASDADRDAEAILAEFRRSAPAIESQAKRGCILYFVVIFGLILAVALGLAYHYAKSRH
jgi:hypothetical protein